MPRSGTGFLYTLLDSHPDLVVHGELFKPRGIGSVSTKLKRELKGQRWFNTEFREKESIEFVTRVLECRSDFKRSGFKLFFPQNETVLKHVISSPEYKVINLTRSNILAMYSSARTAQASGQGKVKIGEKPKQVKIEFDVDDFLNFKRRRDTYVGKGVELLKQSGKEYLDIEYTDLKHDEKLQYILNFLEVPFAGLTAGVKRRNPSIILDRFLNPEAVVDYFTSQGQESWLQQEF